MLAEPIVTLSEAQAYVRIETGEEEALLAGLIRTASGLCEAFIGQVVVARYFELDLPASGVLRTGGGDRVTFGWVRDRRRSPRDDRSGCLMRSAITA